MSAAKEAGNAAFKAGDYGLAVEHYTKALADDPNNHTIFSNRSAAYLKLDKGALALKDAEACITWKADFARGWLRKGQAHEQLDQWRDVSAPRARSSRCHPPNQPPAGRTGG